MFVAPALVVLSLLAGVPDLTDAQRLMLQGVTDRTPQIDEAGLYALLANANEWTGEASALAAGAMIPDFPAIRAEPDTHRGQRFLIEGKLISVGVPPLLSRSGWSNVQPWYIETETGGYVIVYLTAAPEIGFARERDGHRIPKRVGMHVRAVGRFYKLQAIPNTRGEPRIYQVFVGQTATVGAPGGGDSTTLRTAGVVLAVVVLIGAYAVIRLTLPKRRGVGRRPRHNADEQDEAEGELDIRDDLPDDPAAALDVLTCEKDEQRKTIVNPLEAALAESGDEPPAEAEDQRT